MDTAHKIGTAEMWNERIAAIRAGGIASIADAILTRWFSPAFHRDQPAELAGWRNMLTRTPLEGYLGCCAAIRDADLTEAARGARRANACAWSATRTGRRRLSWWPSWRTSFPSGRLITIEGAGHLPCVEQPDAVAAAMLGFLAENRLG